MKYHRFNKYEKKELKQQFIQNALSGEGVYLFQNNSDGDLTLPRPTKSGLRNVGPRREFQGDNYYMQFVKTGLLRLIKEIQSPNQPQPVSEAIVNEEKLILDQPDTVTNHGKVEHVVNKKSPKKPLNEGDQDPSSDVLLNEGPSGFIVVGD